MLRPLALNPSLQSPTVLLPSIMATLILLAQPVLINRTCNKPMEVAMLAISSR